MPLRSDKGIGLWFIALELSDLWDVRLMGCQTYGGTVFVAYPLPHIYADHCQFLDGLSDATEKVNSFAYQ